MVPFEAHYIADATISPLPPHLLTASCNNSTMALGSPCACTTDLCPPTGHRDSVTCTGFSHDGKYVATGDMSGGVRVWSVEERQPVCAFDTSDIEV